jgi:hypothetical protein
MYNPTDEERIAIIATVVCESRVFVEGRVQHYLHALEEHYEPIPLARTRAESPNGPHASHFQWPSVNEQADREAREQNQLVDRVLTELKL